MPDSSLSSRHQRVLSAVILGVSLLIQACGTKHPDGYQGYTEADYVYIASSQPGRLDSVAVRRGQSIPAGTALYFLDSDLESAALAQAREQLAAAESQLEDLKQGRRPQEIDVIKAQLAQAKANEELTASTFKRQSATFETGGVSAEQLDVVRTQAELAKERVIELQNQLRVASLPARENQVSAQTSLVEAARAAAQQAEWRYNQKAVQSQTDGLVVDVMYEPGEWVPTGGVVVRFLPPQNLKIRFFVPETLISSLTVGQPVTVSCDGCATTVAGTISFISPTAEYTPPIIYSNDTRSKLVYMIEARPNDPLTSKLNIGQPVSVVVQ